MQVTLKLSKNEGELFLNDEEFRLYVMRFIVGDSPIPWVDVL